MVKKKKDEATEKPSPKKTIEKKPVEVVEKYPLTELFEKNNIRALKAVGFLKFYGLTEDFAKEHAGLKASEFSQEEFIDLYERYMKREI